jgi:hypothetical protein
MCSNSHLSPAQRASLSQLSDAWVLTAGAAITLNGHPLSLDGEHVTFNAESGTITIASAVEKLRERCMRGPYAFPAIRALDGLEDLLIRTRGWAPFVDTTSGEGLVRADNGDAYTRAFAVECIREEVASWEEPAASIEPVPYALTRTLHHLDALAAEVARLAQREIESARAQHPLDSARVTDEHRAARHRIENTLRAKARELGLSLVALGRLMGYLHEHANTAERA